MSLIERVERALERGVAVPREDVEALLGIGRDRLFALRSVINLIEMGYPEMAARVGRAALPRPTGTACPDTFDPGALILHPERSDG